MLIGMLGGIFLVTCSFRKEREGCIGKGLGLSYDTSQVLCTPKLATVCSAAKKVVYCGNRNDNLFKLDVLEMKEYLACLRVASAPAYKRKLVIIS
jgi:hypothetical protein